MKFSSLLNNIAFTKQESKILLFISGVLVVGLIYNNFIKGSSVDESVSFDYSKQDEKFFSAIEKDENFQQAAAISKEDVLNNTNKSKNNFKKKITSTDHKININQASIDELTTLPGIGAKTANAIVEYRIKYGSFKALNDLKKVKGIGDKKFLALRDFIMVKS